METDLTGSYPNWLIPQEAILQGVVSQKVNTQQVIPQEAVRLKSFQYEVGLCGIVP